MSEILNSEEIWVGGWVSNKNGAEVNAVVRKNEEGYFGGIYVFRGRPHWCFLQYIDSVPRQTFEVARTVSSQYQDQWLQGRLTVQLELAGDWSDSMNNLDPSIYTLMDLMERMKKAETNDVRRHLGRTKKSYLADRALTEIRDVLREAKLDSEKHSRIISAVCYLALPDVIRNCDRMNLNSKWGERIEEAESQIKNVWYSKFEVKPADHHRPLAAKILTEIEDVVGVDNLGLIENLSIRTDSQYDSLEVCMTAGGVVFAGSDNSICKALYGVIHDKAPDTRAGTVSVGDKASVECSDIKQQPEVSDSCPVESCTGPAVEILSAVGIMNEILKTVDCDSKKRLEALKKRIEAMLKKNSNMKPLATIEKTSLASIEPDRFPNFTEFFEYLRAQFALAALGDGVFRLPPILLLGEPGIGKTEVLARLARAVDTEIRVFNLGAAQSGAMLAGSEIFWDNSKHGELFELLVFGRTANPIVVLDEIDKVSADTTYSPIGGLYHLLEKRTAANFEDLSLPGVRVDASHVNWFAAANDPRTIDPAILSRFRIFNIPSPTREQMPTIIKSIYSDLLAHERWGKAFSPELPKDVLSSLANISPRQVRQIMEAACARAAKDGRTYLAGSDIEEPHRSRRAGFLAN